MGPPRDSARSAALALAPAAVPLAAIPYAGTHTRRHPLIGVTAAPFFAAAAIRARRVMTMGGIPAERRT